MFLFRHVGKLSHILVFLPLRLVIGRMKTVDRPVPGGPVVAYAQLQAETVAKRNELMKGAVVANEPGRYHGKESQSSEGCRQEPALPATMQPVTSPDPQRGQYREHNWLRQRGESVEQAKSNPWQEPGRGLQVQSDQKKRRKQQGREDGGPDEVGREKNRIGEEHPSPAGGHGHMLSESSSCYEEYRQASQGGEEAVQRQCHDKRGFGVRPKNPEDRREKIRINGR